MQNQVFIGTLHAWSTPHQELASVLEKYAPDVLFVEIQQTDIETGDLDNYPDEMVFALQRAQEKGIPVHGFDSPISAMREWKTEIDNQRAIDEQNIILKRYTRKDANKREVIDELITPFVRSITDREKHAKREEEMLVNIKNLLDPDKKTVIVMGAGHLNFFQKRYPQSLFPLR